jgi:cytochrome c-type biogenesis protein CcmH/NrfF
VGASGAATRFVAALVLAALWPLAWAQQPARSGPGAAAEDPALEKRVAGLAHELRCLVCQNQSLADSHAPLAMDLKNQVREQLRAGRSDAQVIDYMTQRYGDFVLYRPPVKATTWLLWGGPLLLLAVGALALWRLLGRSSRAAPDAPLPPEAAARLAEMLEAKPAQR